MEISLTQFCEAISRAVDVGMQLNQRAIAPDGDRLSQAQAKRYIKALGYKPVMIDKWRKAKLLHGRKSSTQQSATVYYSLAELKTLIIGLKSYRITQD